MSILWNAVCINMTAVPRYKSSVLFWVALVDKALLRTLSFQLAVSCWLSHIFYFYFGETWKTLRQAREGGAGVNWANGCRESQRLVLEPLAWRFAFGSVGGMFSPNECKGTQALLLPSAAPQPHFLVVFTPLIFKGPWEWGASRLRFFLALCVDPMMDSTRLSRLLTLSFTFYPLDCPFLLCFFCLCVCLNAVGFFLLLCLFLSMTHRHLSLPFYVKIGFFLGNIFTYSKRQFVPITVCFLSFWDGDVVCKHLWDVQTENQGLSRMTRLPGLS